MPGGSLEPGETEEQAALRETFEEIGVEPERVRLLGALSPLSIEVSRFQVSPFVGWTEGRPAFKSQESEVERIVEGSVSELLDPSFMGIEVLGRSDRRGPAPCYRLAEGLLVWGATAMILAELSVVLREIL